MLMQSSAFPYVFFTDLDGTLLDHDTYDFEPARPAMNLLIQNHIPWVLNTSKTLAELQSLRKRLSHTHPVIVENGAGVAIPVGYFRELEDTLSEKDGFLYKAFGTPRARILEIVHQLRTKGGYRFEGFDDWSLQQVMHATGLAKESAREASQRFFSEPIQWNGSTAEKQFFLEELQTHGLFGLQGGRFLHIMGDVDKGRTALWLHQQYQKEWSHLTQTIGLGDSGNDIALLEIVDIACIIRSPAHAPPQLHNKPNPRISSSFGPAGWNELVSKILSL